MNYSSDNILVYTIPKLVELRMYLQKHYVMHKLPKYVLTALLHKYVHANKSSVHSIKFHILDYSRGSLDSFGSKL